MLIGGDDISNDVITLGGCFHMFFKVCYIPTRFRFMLIAEVWQLSQQRTTGELEAEIEKRTWD